MPIYNEAMDLSLGPQILRIRKAAIIEKDQINMISMQIKCQTMGPARSYYVINLPTELIKFNDIFIKIYYEKNHGL